MDPSGASNEIFEKCKVVIYVNLKKAQSEISAQKCSIAI